MTPCSAAFNWRSRSFRAERLLSGTFRSPAAGRHRLVSPPPQRPFQQEASSFLRLGYRQYQPPDPRHRRRDQATSRSLFRATFFFDGATRDGQEGAGQQAEGDVTVPAIPFPHLVVVQAHLALGLGEALLHRPAVLAHLDEFSS